MPLPHSGWVLMWNLPPVYRLEPSTPGGTLCISFIQHGVPPNESPGVCCKKHRRSQEKTNSESCLRFPASVRCAAFDSSSCHPAGFLGIDVSFLLIQFLKVEIQLLFFFFLPVIWLFWEKGPFESAAVTRSDNLTTLQHSVWQLSPRHTAAFWDWFSPPAVWWKKKKEKKKKRKSFICIQRPDLAGSGTDPAAPLPPRQPMIICPLLGWPEREAELAVGSNKPSPRFPPPPRFLCKNK